MAQKDTMYRLLENCEIYFENELISRESLIRAYSEFLMKCFVTNEKTVSLTLHTGSICFEIITLLFASFGTIFLDDINVDEVLESMDVGDMVLYKNERYFWGGFGCIPQRDFIPVDDMSKATHFLIEQKKIDKRFGESIIKHMCPIINKNLLAPYMGNSITTDGRGIRNKKGVRLDFMTKVLGIPRNEIRNVSGASSIVVTERENAERLMKGIDFVYDGGKTCDLLDLVTASYFTESDEYPLRGNIGKNDPIIKFVGKVSIARELIFDKSGNKAVILLILDSESIEKGKSELPELISRKALKFISLLSDMNTQKFADLTAIFEISDYFICTKKYLSQHTLQVEKNKLTDELNFQVQNTLNKQIITKVLPGKCDCEQYRKAKEALILIRKSDFDNIAKQDFLIESHSLLNLFSTAAFLFNRISDMASKNTPGGRVASPDEKLKHLWELAGRLPASLADKAFIVLELLEILIKQIEPLKYIELKKMLYFSRSKKIAVIVPKAYYVDLLSSDKTLLSDNVTFVNGNKFDNKEKYDEIIVVGDFLGRRFDIFRCNSAHSITTLLYEYEKSNFEYKRMLFDKSENELDQKMLGVSSPQEDEQDINAAENTYVENLELDVYVEKIKNDNFLNYALSLSHQTASVMGEAVSIGTFTSGDKILFSKFYKALVFDKSKGTVSETDISKLAQGDVLVFTKRNNMTKNIVDDILENLFANKQLPNKVVEADFKAKYWKLLLQEYMENNNLSFKDVSNKLSTLGCKRHELTIRTWLGKDYGIIGPNDEEAFIQIAALTGDSDMQEDAHSFYEACKLVRHTRRNILNLIGQAIIDIYRGNKHSKDRILQAVYENVEDIAFTLELDSVTELDKPLDVFINLLNKPILEEV